jgi:hypothetical protein
MNLALTESIFRYSKSLIVHAFEKLSPGNRYFWRVSVNTPNRRKASRIAHNEMLSGTRELSLVGLSATRQDGCSGHRTRDIVGGRFGRSELLGNCTTVYRSQQREKRHRGGYAD